MHVCHGTGEDPDAAGRVGEIARNYRAQFGSDVVIDLIGFRRHGHSEVDDPTVTQPLLYAKIKDHPPLWQIYAGQNGFDARSIVTEVRKEFDESFAEATQPTENPVPHQLPPHC